MDIEKIRQELLRELGEGPAAPPEYRPVCADEVPARLEHSLLVPDLTLDKLLADCRMARLCGIAAVCVPPYYVADAAQALAGCGVGVCAAVGFPSALLTTEAKAADVKACVAAGACELDIAIDMAAVKSGNLKRARRDFLAAADAAGDRAAVKAVFEHGAYTEDEKKQVLELIGKSGVPYIKIQNLLSGVGAREEELLLVRAALGDTVRIKIDGGVKTLDRALQLFAAGAHRIGLTATKAVADEAVAQCRTAP